MRSYSCKEHPESSPNLPKQHVLSTRMLIDRIDTIIVGISTLVPPHLGACNVCIRGSYYATRPNLIDHPERHGPTNVEVILFIKREAIYMI